MTKGLERALKVLETTSTKQHSLVLDLTSEEFGQSHMFDKWKNDESIKELGDQLEQLDAAYPGGLRQYIVKAKKLLEDSKKGLNPLDGWSPSVPEGEAFQLGTPEYESTERLGMSQLGKVGFILVAGGLGERLGYNGTKVSVYENLIELLNTLNSF